ncbi:hypothetical protein ACFQZC_25790 [Streptacidiphilus monticola]
MSRMPHRSPTWSAPRTGAAGDEPTAFPVGPGTGCSRIRPRGRPRAAGRSTALCSSSSPSRRGIRKPSTRARWPTASSGWPRASGPTAAAVGLVDRAAGG